MKVNTAMRHAFINARVRKDAKGSIINAVGKAFEQGIGVRSVPDWNAHLKHTTYQHLVRMGVMK